MIAWPPDKRFIIAAITIMWLLAIPLELLFWINVVGWPLDLALLLSLPIMAVWIPLGYPMAIAGYERYQSGAGPDHSPGALARSGLLGVLSGAPSVCAVWLYMLLHAAMYCGIAIVGLLGSLLVWFTAHVARQLLRRMRSTQSEASE
jgi:hypothetical protein